MCVLSTYCRRRHIWRKTKLSSLSKRENDIRSSVINHVFSDDDDSYDVENEDNNKPKQHHNGELS